MSQGFDIELSDAKKSDHDFRKLLPIFGGIYLITEPKNNTFHNTATPNPSFKTLRKSKRVRVSRIQNARIQV